MKSAIGTVFKIVVVTFLLIFAAFFGAPFFEEYMTRDEGEEGVDDEFYELIVDTEGDGMVHIEPDQDEYESGTDVDLTAEPDDGWMFIEWNDDHSGENKEITITMDNDKSITAYFEKIDVDFDVSDFSVEVDEMNATVTAVVENVGDIEDAINLTIDGESVYHMTLNVDEIYELNYTHTFEEEGKYEINLGTESYVANIGEDEPIEGLEYHFIDVGQADATLIKTNEANKLVDAGHWQRSDTVDYLNDIGVEKIDYLITTHPHADHIGEADDIINDFGVETVFRSGYEHDTYTYERYVDAIEENDVEEINPRAGEQYTLETVTLDMLNPTEETFNEAVEDDDMHLASLSFTVNYQDHSVMFTGDAEKEAEQRMIDNDYDLEVDLYQVGHHGSYTSSSEDFLDAMDPSTAIISCGEDNQYGHPHDVVIDRLEERGIEIRRTDEEGTIIIEP